MRPAISLILHLHMCAKVLHDKCSFLSSNTSLTDFFLCIQCFFRTFLQIAVRTPLNKRSRLRYVKSPVKYHKWCFDEDRAVLEFVSISRVDPKYDFSKAGSPWPSFRASHIFWSDAARHIREATSSSLVSIVIEYHSMYS